MKTNSIVLLTILIGFSFNAFTQTVYVTKTGEKYHKRNCRYLKYSKKEISIDKAITLGYQACSICKPPIKNNISTTSKLLTTNGKTKKTTATQCTGKTKSGSRCKRKTKNSNGYCYQHQ